MTGNQIAKARTTLRDRAKRWMGPLGVFIRGAFDHPRMVGAVFPSSGSTVEGMLTRVDWASCKLVVEYGPGVGTFTQPLLDKLPRDAQLVAIEPNPHFVDHLSKTIRDSRLCIVQGSAADVEEIVEATGHEAADIVISGIPFSTLPDGLGDEIGAASYRVLRKGGAFLTYQYRSTARKLTEKHFDRIDRQIVWRNTPPNQLVWGWKA